MDPHLFDAVPKVLAACAAGILVIGLAAGFAFRWLLYRYLG